MTCPCRLALLAAAAAVSPDSNDVGARYGRPSASLAEMREDPEQQDAEGQAEATGPYYPESVSAFADGALPDALMQEAATEDDGGPIGYSAANVKYYSALINEKNHARTLATYNQYPVDTHGWETPVLLRNPGVSENMMMNAKERKLPFPTATPVESDLRRYSSGDPLAYVAGRGKIPPYLFLTSKYSSLEALPASVMQNVQNTLDLNPGLTVTWFDDNDCLKYMQRTEENRVADLFMRATSGKYRSDLCRTLVLLHRGGFYVDLDVEMKMPFDKLVDRDTTFMSVWAVDGDVLNALIGTEPNNPIINMTLAEMKKGDDKHALTLKEPPTSPPIKLMKMTGVPESPKEQRLDMEVTAGGDTASGAHRAEGAAAGAASADATTKEAATTDATSAGATTKEGASADGTSAGAKAAEASTDTKSAAADATATKAASADGTTPDAEAPARAAEAEGADQSAKESKAKKSWAAVGAEAVTAMADVVLHNRARREQAPDSEPSSLAQVGESMGSGYALWGPKTLRAGLVRYFMSCGVDSTILPSAELQTADYEQCGQRVRMYTELNMRRPVDLGKHMHPLYYILHHKHSISNTMLRAALHSEGRNNTPPEKIVKGKKVRGFDGLDFGLFYTGYPNFLVGYSRFVSCHSYGCGADGDASAVSKAADARLLVAKPAAPEGDNKPGSSPDAPVFRTPEGQEQQKVNPLNDLHQQKLAKLDRSLQNLRRQISEHQRPTHRHLKGWETVGSYLELGPELMAVPVDVYLQQGVQESLEQPFAGVDGSRRFMQSRTATGCIFAVMALIPAMFHMARFDILPKAQEVTHMQARLLWGAAYAGCSIVMTIGNKLAVQGSPVLLSAIQMAFAVVALGSVLGPTFGIQSSGDKSMLYMWLPVPFFFVTMICSSLSGFSHESISTCVMMGALRPLYALTIERVCFGQGPSSMAVIGCLLLCCGAALYVAGSGGTTGGVTMFGLGMLAMNGVTAAVDRCYQHYLLVHQSINASRSALLLTSNLGGLVLLLMMPGLWRAEIPAMAGRASRWASGSDMADLNIMLLSCLGGLGIGYCGLGFQKTVTASTFLAVATGVRAFLLLIDNQVLGTEMQQLGGVGLVVVIIGSVVCVDDQNRKSVAAPASAEQSPCPGTDESTPGQVAQCPDSSGATAAPAG